MPDFEEYTYEKSHISEKEALERYKTAKSKYSNSLVVLDNHDCGHWTVDIFETEREKEVFLRKRIADYLAGFWSHLKRI